MPSLTEIAEGILADAKRIDASLSSQNLPSTSFDKDTLSSLSHDIDPIRKSLVDSTQALKRLTLGPVAHQLEICFGVSNHSYFSSLPKSPRFDSVPRLRMYWPFRPSIISRYHNLSLLMERLATRISLQNVARSSMKAACDVLFRWP